MGVVGSLPLNENNDIQNEISLLSFNQTTFVIPNVINDNHHQSSKNISSDYLCVKKHHSNISSGRCSKHKLRCKKSLRKSRMLTSTNNPAPEELRQQISELELKQNNLLSQVEKLYLYKQQLEVICQQVRNSNHEFIL